MPGSNVNWPGAPLTRLLPFYPGQLGVPGSDTDLGLRLHSTGDIFWVDRNNADPSDLRDGTNPLSPLATIGAALAKCRPYRGDVVAVMANGAWDYASGANAPLPVNEAVTVTVDGVRLVGVFPSSAIGVPWQLGTTVNPAITVQAMDVVIEGFCFMGSAGETAIRAQWGGSNYGENLVVRHCFFDTGIGSAIELSYAWNCQIHDNHFQGCTYGIRSIYTTSGADYLVVRNNLFANCTDTAIHMPLGEECHILGNYFFADNLAGGYEFINLTGGNDNFVAGNFMGCLIGGAATYNSANVAGTGDYWVANWCRDAMSVANPA